MSLSLLPGRLHRGSSARTRDRRRGDRSPDWLPPLAVYATSEALAYGLAVVAVSAALRAVSDPATTATVQATAVVLPVGVLISTGRGHLHLDCRYHHRSRASEHSPRIGLRHRCQSESAVGWGLSRLAASTVDYWKVVLYRHCHDGSVDSTVRVTAFGTTVIGDLYRHHVAVRLCAVTWTGFGFASWCLVGRMSHRAQAGRAASSK